MAAFAKLEFPRQLASLEQYIGATGYIRHLIPYYSQLVEPLQERKVALLAQGRKEGRVVDNNLNKRKAYTRTTFYEPTEQERIAFKALQESIATGQMLLHLDPQRRLFLQVDGS